MITPTATDDDWLRARLDAAAAASAMRRVAARLGPGQVVFTAGARPGDWFGYRSYAAFNADSGAQAAILHDWRTGSVQAVAIGNELGPCRTRPWTGWSASAR